MAFCEDCGNKLSETTKFCGECGAKVENKANIPEPDQTKKTPVTRKVKISKPKADVGPINVSTKDNEYLKEFFTRPAKKYKSEPQKPSGIPPQLYLERPLKLLGYGLNRFHLFFLAVVIWNVAIYIGISSGKVKEYNGSDEGVQELSLVLFILVAIFGYMTVVSYYASKNPQKMKAWDEWEESLKVGGNLEGTEWNDEFYNWERISPEPLFSRLEQAQRIVAESSYENLGIDKGNTTRPLAYCYGPHLEIFGDIFGARTDQTGTGKGADYYKFCENKGLEGLYTREYDMMVVQFTKNQIMVYKCIFDILEMTKRLEESYEWNYKHVVGINITGDEKEKDLGSGIAVTGTKYLVISAASGDKIEIVLGAGTRQMVDGKQKITALGGEEKIYKVANTAMKNIREAVREGAS